MRILIADDHPLLRNGLSKLLQEEIQNIQIREAENGLEAIRLIKQTQFDIVILDINMPVMDGFEVLEHLKIVTNPPIPIFLTMYREEQVFYKAMDLGVKGFLLKDDAITDIIRCIEMVKSGRYYISSSLTDVLMRRTTGNKEQQVINKLLESLTQTEKRVLKLLSDMLTSKQIADELNVSVKTVTNHRTNICSKLDLAGSHALLKFALANKLLL